MPATATLQDRTGLLWRALPALLPLILGTMFAVQTTALHGPEALYPAVLALGLAVISGYNLVFDFLRTHKPAESASGTTDHDAPDQDRSEDEAGPVRLTVGRPAAVIALLVLTLTLVTPLGFYTALPVLVVGSLFATGVRTPVTLVAGGAGICTAAYLIFGLVLDVPLPTGIWW